MYVAGVSSRSVLLSSSESMSKVSINSWRASLVTRFPTSHFLELLISIRNAILAKHGLDRFRKDLPVVFEVFRHLLYIRSRPTHPLNRLRDGLVNVAQCHAHITKRRRIGQISLKPRNAEFVGKHAEQCIASFAVALRVFELNRVDFMRHSRRTNLPINRFLADIIHRNIEPEILVNVNQNVRKHSNCIEQFGHPVMVFDLRCNGVDFNPTHVFEKLCCFPTVERCVNATEIAE